VARMRVSLIGELYECVKPLFDRTTRPEGAELVVTRSPSPEAMRRQLTAWEFDICEMAFGAYLIARGQGADVTAIPVFPRRAFFPTNFMCHADARIDGPRDLASKRIGVAEIERCWKPSFSCVMSKGSSATSRRSSNCSCPGPIDRRRCRRLSAGRTSAT
jgi:4,5-dihydroxyphthalate decarboxylase